MRRTLVALTLAMVLPLPVMAAEVVVKPGETLSEIAERHGISMSRLMQLNGISNANHVEAGQRLRLPGGSSASRSAGASTGASASGNVTVQPGETLSEIADRHGISMSRLMQLNGISNANHVEAGQRLNVIGSKASTTAAAGATPQPTYNRNARQHVVRPGESLSQIASGYGIPMSRLVALNQIGDPDLVVSGTRLRLQGEAASAAAPRPQPTPAPRPTPAQASSAATPRPTATPSATPTATAAAVVNTTARATSSPTAPAAAPAPRPQPASTVAVAARSTSPTPTRPDWRNYGPLQIDWSNWQPMGGSFVAPSLNGEGLPSYLAINCEARKINGTTSSGQWKTWDEPKGGHEEQLVTDFCKSRPN